MTRRPEPGAPQDSSPRHATSIRRRSSPRARWSSREATAAARRTSSRARSSTIQLRARGARPARSPRHAISTPRRCFAQGRCSSRAGRTARHSRAPSCTIRRQGPGRARARSRRREVATPRRSSLRGRCSSRGASAPAAPITSLARSCTIRCGGNVEQHGLARDRTLRPHRDAPHLRSGPRRGRPWQPRRRHVSRERGAVRSGGGDVE